MSAARWQKRTQSETGILFPMEKKKCIRQIATSAVYYHPRQRVSNMTRDSFDRTPRRLFNKYLFHQGMAIIRSPAFTMHWDFKLPWTTSIAVSRNYYLPYFPLELMTRCNSRLLGEGYPPRSKPVNKFFIFVARTHLYIHSVCQAGRFVANPRLVDWDPNWRSLQLSQRVESILTLQFPVV